MTLLCQGTWQGVTFLLRREGDDKFQDMAEPDWNGKATFPVNQAGNYSCSYRMQAAGHLSEPSETVTIEELGECLTPSEVTGGGAAGRQSLFSSAAASTEDPLQGQSG